MKVFHKKKQYKNPHVSHEADDAKPIKSTMVTLEDVRGKLNVKIFH
jgi:hypothetical protein